MTTPTSERTSYLAFPELAPAEWFADRTRSSVLLRVYLVVRYPLQEVETSISAPLGQVLAIVRHGGFEVPGACEDVPVGRGEWQGRADPQQRLPDDVYLVLMTAYEVDGAPPEEAAARRRLDVAAGLIAACISPNAVYRQVSEYVQRVSSARVLVLSSPRRSDQAYGAPGFSKDTFNLVRLAYQRMAADPNVRHGARIELSVRWFLAAMNDSSRVDSFVKLWIALEALAAKTHSLVALLADAYRKPKPWIQDRFRIDQLYQLRGDIVHRGRLPQIHRRVLEVTVAVYEDALRKKIGAPCERRAETAAGDRFDPPYLNSKPSGWQPVPSERGDAA